MVTDRRLLDAFYFLRFLQVDVA